ncbi:MAG: hypothetical protein IRZ16_10890 [Myxococcaceae bacterium]|nr:hypothetical protein [Myxococcaceae bacterium]
MCPACGRPQPERPVCAHCGAPMAGARAAGSGVDRPVAATEGREVDLGDGRRLRFEEDALVVVTRSGATGSPRVLGPARNVIGRDAPARLELKTVQRARLRTVRLWPLLALVAVCAILAALSDTWAVRIVPTVLLVVGIWLFLRVRYFVVRFECREGQDAWLFLGAGASGSNRGVSAQSVWADLARELQRRGVEARPR